MKPLLLLFWGVVLVGVDFRFGAFDILPDLVGWLMAVAGLRQLTSRDRWFTAAAVAAGLGAVVGTAQLAPGALPAALLAVGETVATTGLVVATCTGIARVAVSQPAVARRARRIRTAELAFAVLTLLISLAARAEVVMTGLLLFVVALAVLAVVAWFLVLLWSIKGHQDFQTLPMNTEVA